MSDSPGDLDSLRSTGAEADRLLKSLEAEPQQVQYQPVPCQPVRRLSKVGSCPTGYRRLLRPQHQSKSWRRSQDRQHLSDWFLRIRGGYCLSSPGNRRQAIEKTGPTCPSGWITSERYCLH